MPKTASVQFDPETKVLTLRRRELAGFIVEAKLRGYAGMGAEAYTDTETQKGTLQFSFTKGPFSFFDEYFGDRVFFGMETVSARDSNGKLHPVWAMAYGGEVFVGGPPQHEVYKFLVEALKRVPRSTPYRGPAGTFSSKRFPFYQYKLDLGLGNLDDEPSLERAVGEETITLGPDVIYTCNFTGGLAQQSKGSIRLI